MQNLIEFLTTYNLTLGPEYDVLMGTYSIKSWWSFERADNKYFLSNDAIDLLDNLLKFDHAKRLTAREVAFALEPHNN